MRRLAIILAFLLVVVGRPSAQQTVTIRATDPTTGTSTNVGDAENAALRIKVTAPLTSLGAGYNVSTTPFSMETLTGGATEVQVDNDDQLCSIPVPIPFVFWGATISDVCFADTGYITTITGQAVVYDILADHGSFPSIAQPNGVIAPFWSVLEPQDPPDDGTVHIKHEVFGMAPNRVWVIEYRNTPVYPDLINLATFQVKIFESPDGITNSTIEFHVENGPLGDGPPFSYAWMQGLENALGTQAICFGARCQPQTVATLSNDAVRFVAGTNNDAAVSTFVTNSVSVVPFSSPWIVGGDGSPGSSSTNVVSVQGVPSMSPILTGLNFIGGDNITRGYVSNDAPLGLQSVFPVGRYLATQPTLTDGLFNSILLGSRGSLRVTPGAEGFNVACTSGCAGGTSDVDDGTVAAGQTTGLNIGLTHVFDGTDWKRLTIGSAGVPSAQVVSVQGISNGSSVRVGGGTLDGFSPGSIEPVAAGAVYHLFQGTRSPNAISSVELTEHGALITSPGSEGFTVQAQAYDSASNPIASATTTPGASDRGLVVRDIPSPAPSPTTMQNAATGTGNGTSLSVTGKSYAILRATATTSDIDANVILEKTIDGSNWTLLYCALEAVTASHQLTVSDISLSDTSYIDLQCPVSNYTSIRARIASYSGTAGVTVIGTASNLPRSMSQVDAFMSLLTGPVTFNNPVSVTPGQGGFGVTLGAETSKVIGTVRMTGNIGAVVDGTIGAGTAPANQVVTGGVYTSPEINLTSGQSSAVQLDSRGRQRTVIMDAATNSRGVNVDANNNLQVTLAGTGSNATAVNIAAASLPLPSTAATSTKQSDGSQKTQVVDGSGNVVGTTATGGNGLLVGQSGNWTNRIVGNAGATLDSTVGVGTAPANAVTTGTVFNSTAPAPTTGQAMAVQSDQSGNIRTVPGIATATLSVWNSGTALNTTQNIFTNHGTSAALVHLVQSSGTFSAGQITFEITYDGTNWVTIPADAVHDPASTTWATISLPYTLVTSTNKPFLLHGKGWQGLRIKLSTAITGTGTVTPNYALLADNPVADVIALSPTAANFNVTNTQNGTASQNVAQVNGVTTLTGNGVTGTGSQRVTIASDNTAFSVNATLSAETTKVIGTARILGNSGSNLDGTTAGILDVEQRPSTSTNVALTTTTKATLTTSSNVKASAGNVYGAFARNGAASLCWVQFINSSGAGTLGTGVIFSVPLAASAVVHLPPGGLALANFSSGIAVGIATTATGNTACGTAGDVVVFYQ